MNPATHALNIDTTILKGVSEPIWQENRIESDCLETGIQCASERIGTMTSFDASKQEETARSDSKNRLPMFRQNTFAINSEMTVASFIERVFVPHHVSLKKPSGRVHYQAMLRYVITPDEVDRIFRVAAVKTEKKLKNCADWPYLDKVRLCDAGAIHVGNLVSAVLAKGYSTQTATHVRNTVSAIFTCARQRNILVGDNPAKSVMPPEIVRGKSQSMTLGQVREVLGAMQYPEREMALVALLTPMTMAEICAMQWKYINLSWSLSSADGELIPPRTIAVRNNLDHGEFVSAIGRRRRNLEIHHRLFDVLLRLEHRAKFTQPSDYVFVSGEGGALSSRHGRSNRLISLGKQLRMPWLSWQVLHRTRLTLLSEFGTSFYEFIADLASAA